MDSKIIKKGIALYQETAPIRIMIEEVDSIPGSGDYEDPDDIREEKYGKFYYLSHSMAGDSKICNGRGYFPTIDEAIKEAENIFKDIKWNNP